MKLWDRWKLTSLPNKLLVVASIFMALGTLSSGVVAYFQYRMLQKQSDSMKEQSQTTKAELKTMDDQSQVMQNTLHTLRDEATSTVYLRMRDRYFEVWKRFPEHYENLNIQRDDKNWQLFKEYWYVSLDEWYVTKKIEAFRDLWPDYYEYAYSRSLEKKSMRTSLCILKGEEFQNGVNREFVSALEELYSRKHVDPLCK